MINAIKTRLSQRTLILIALLSIALVSIFVISGIVTSKDFNAETVKSLDDKKVVVMRLAAAAAASSTAISLIPGDVGMPIANQIAELSSYFIVVLSAILLEKMLISVVGYVSFTYIIPFACFLYSVNLYVKKDILKNIALKLTIFGMVIFVAIPVSIKVSYLIYSSYQATIEQTVETATENKDFIENKKKELSEEDKDWIAKIGDSISNFTSTIGNGIAEITKKGEQTLSTFLEAIAVLIITTCVIPIIVILIFAWSIKIIFGFSIPTKQLKKKFVKTLHRQRETQ